MTLDRQEESVRPTSTTSPDHPSTTSAQRPVLLEMKLCHVRYGLVPALHGMSLIVHQGEMVALLGPNGAGKTTTLRAISGVVKSHSGQITFKGSRINGNDPPQVVRLGIAHMPEGRALFGQLSVEENLRYGYLIHRKDRASYKPLLNSVYDTFPKLRERHRQKAATLSGGEQQMLTAGIALMSKPELLLVDELSLGLAPMIVRQLFEALKEVNRRGAAILLVEQFVDLALANTQRAYVLSKGKVAASRASNELRDDPALIASYLGATEAGHTSPPPSPRGSRTGALAGSQN